MIAVPRQLVLDLAHRQALGAEDFLVSRSNSEAVELIDRWPDWPHPASIVIGTQGSGKTHLSHVWQLRSSAGLVAASAITDAAVAALADGDAVVVEDLDRGIADEQALFHLLNRAGESKLAVLKPIEWCQTAEWLGNPTTPMVLSSASVYVGWDGWAGLTRLGGVK